MPRIGDTLKKLKRLLTIALAAAMLAAAAATVPIAGARTDAALAVLEDKLAAATAQREAAEQAVTTARGSYADAVAEKKAIDAKLVALEGEIDALLALIDGYNADIASKNEILCQNLTAKSRKFIWSKKRFLSKNMCLKPKMPSKLPWDK